MQTNVSQKCSGWLAIGANVTKGRPQAGLLGYTLTLKVTHILMIAHTSVDGKLRHAAKPLPVLLFKSLHSVSVIRRRVAVN